MNIKHVPYLILKYKRDLGNFCKLSCNDFLEKKEKKIVIEIFHLILPFIFPFKL